MSVSTHYFSYIVQAVTSAWILATGSWVDSGLWEDTSNWID